MLLSSSPFDDVSRIFECAYKRTRTRTHVRIKVRKKKSPENLRFNEKEKKKKKKIRKEWFTFRCCCCCCISKTLIYALVDFFSVFCHVWFLALIIIRNGRRRGRRKSEGEEKVFQLFLRDENVLKEKGWESFFFLFPLPSSSISLLSPPPLHRVFPSFSSLWNFFFFVSFSSFLNFT